jgi:transcriptional regulator with XRE-family HTH domain
MAMAENWRPEDRFGLRLRMLRYSMGLSVEEIAERCGVHTATWSSWERGTAPRGMNQVVDTIASVTGCDREWLMWGGPLRAPSTKWKTAGAGSASGAVAA